MSSTLLSPLLPTVGNTPLVPLRKLLKPYKKGTPSCAIHAKCEFRNPSGCIWDRLVCHEMNTEIVNHSNFVTGGISDLCLSLAWAGASSSVDDLSVAVLPGCSFEQEKLHLCQGFGANVILSYQQELDRRDTLECLSVHINKLEEASGVQYHRILPNASKEESQDTNPYDTLVAEVAASQFKWDIVVCSGQDKNLLQSLRKKFPEPDTLVIGVDFTGNEFTETFLDDSTLVPGIKWVHISESECYDMARRLVREEGIMVGPVSGGVMAAAMKETFSVPAVSPSPTNILVILPDSLQNTNRAFLSVDWMVQKGFYSISHLESLFWWYEMAIENLSPPEVLIATPETSVKSVYAAMTASSKDRCVVVGENKRVIGVVNIDSIASKCEQDNVPIGEVCIKQFGMIDSKANFPELAHLLQKYHWVVNIHRVPLYVTTPTTSTGHQLVLQTSEDVIGVVNMADFIRYKRKVERHHLTEYGLAMSDGIPSEVWLERFSEHLKIINSS